MAKLSDLMVKLLDDREVVDRDGYRGQGFYLVDPCERIYAGPFRTRAAANAHLDELWYEPRTG